MVSEAPLQDSLLLPSSPFSVSHIGHSDSLLFRPEYLNVTWQDGSRGRCLYGLQKVRLR